MKNSHHIILTLELSFYYSSLELSIWVDEFFESLLKKQSNDEIKNELAINIIVLNTVLLN